MTSDELKAWIERHKLTHQQAAQVLGLSIAALRKRLYGVVPVGTQTERIIEALALKRELMR